MKALETIDTSEIAEKLTRNHKELQEAVEEVLDEYRVNVINNVKNRYNLDDITFANYALSSKHDMIEPIQTLRNLFGNATGITDENLAETITYNAEAAKVISQLSGFEEEIYNALNDLSRSSDLAEAGTRTIREARNNNLTYETANVYRTIGEFNKDLQERTTFDIYDLNHNHVLSAWFAQSLEGTLLAYHLKGGIEYLTLHYYYCCHLLVALFIYSLLRMDQSILLFLFDLPYNLLATDFLCIL